MPSGKNWLNYIYLNLGFLLCAIYIFYCVQISQIKANWPLYRCNPMYMPLADDVQSNFVYCIQTMQSNFMGYLLEPLTFLTGSMTSTISGFLNEINSIRAMFDKIRNFTSSIVQSVFGVFLNLIIEFQKIIIGIKDLMGKTIGILVTIMYVMDGSIKTMESAWNGPAGQMVQSLGKCFHPLTKIKLKNNNIVYIKDIKLGDILENGSIVESTMQINNKVNPEVLYEIKNGDTSIYVTGSHLVLNKETKKFIKVENYKKALKTNVTTDWLCCLITNNHNIHIGKEIFWDWEDHFIKYPYYCNTF
jgi:hypothetical protein